MFPRHRQLFCRVHNTISVVYLTYGWFIDFLFFFQIIYILFNFCTLKKIYSILCLFLYCWVVNSHWCIWWWRTLSSTAAPSLWFPSNDSCKVSIKWPLLFYGDIQPLLSSDVYLNKKIRKTRPSVWAVNPTDDATTLKVWDLEAPGVLYLLFWSDAHSQL